MVEQKPSKLTTRVRFPSPAPYKISIAKTNFLIFSSIALDFVFVIAVYLHYRIIVIVEEEINYG